MRGEAYRAEGWERFEEHSEPYTLSEISAERVRYSGEDRSFANRDLADSAYDANDRTTRDRPAGAGIATPIPGAES
ncbi:MAG: hypothetical protein B7Y99_02475 [Caulobacterales bacterium 32-69-10]|nr:MAG: hypothetical protein B7Y99_02475 [Caulobacterales bacterium 32-69-10]